MFKGQNLRNCLYLVSFALSILCLIGVGLRYQNQHHRPLEISFEGAGPELTMPIVKNDPFAHLAANIAPNPQRGIEFRKWLQATVRIRVSWASGSGTIVYYNEKDGWAYVQTCGHLWGGMRRNMSGEEGKRRQLKCKVNVWYHNQKKLRSPKTYPAEVLYYNNGGQTGAGHDVALIRFKPDWKPNYFPIAPEDFEFREGMRLHSMGCDHASETAHYDVRVIGFSGRNFPHLVTTENSPRPGRSGGGLLSEDYYVATCWGTSDKSGNGNGYFTPLKTVRHYNEKNGYGWLNEVSDSLARKIPIVDRNNPQGRYSRDYIPIPGGR